MLEGVYPSLENFDVVVSVFHVFEIEPIFVFFGFLDDAQFGGKNLLFIEPFEHLREG